MNYMMDVEHAIKIVIEQAPNARPGERVIALGMAAEALRKSQVKAPQGNRCLMCWHIVRPTDYYCSFCGQRVRTFFGGDIECRNQDR